MAVLDTSFTIISATDPTKRMRFDLSGLSPNATRILSVFDASMVLVGADTAQALTNKTIPVSQLTGLIATPRLGNGVADATTFLRGDQIYAVPPGTGGSGETNTASNAGTGGVGLTLTKVGVDLPFKSIGAASTKIVVTDVPADKRVDIELGAIGAQHLVNGVTGDGAIVLAKAPILYNSLGKPVLEFGDGAAINPGVNHLRIDDSDTGFPPSINAVGSSVVIDIDLVPKGSTGRLRVNDVKVPTVNSEDALYNKSFQDDNTPFFNSTDPTKKVKLDCSLLDTETTRIYSLPNAAVDAVLVAVDGVLGTPESGVLTNCTGLPNAAVIGLGTLATQSGTFSGTSSGTNTGDNAANSSSQPASANLDEYAAVNPTAAGLALLDDADATAQRATLGLGSIATLSSIAPTNQTSPARRQAVLCEIHSPAAGESYRLRPIPDAATLKAVRHIVSASTNVVFNIEIRAETTPFTAGTDVWSADKTATTTSTEETAFDNQPAAATILVVTITSVSGTPTIFLVQIEYEVD